MWSSEWRNVEGVRVGVVVPAGMNEEACYKRIETALQLINRTVPYRAARLRRDMRGILCFGTGRDASLGAYVPLYRICLVDPRHVVDAVVEAQDLARTILHEATHARLHRCGFPEAVVGSKRVEAVCERAERDFDRKNVRSS